MILGIRVISTSNDSLAGPRERHQDRLISRKCFVKWLLPIFQIWTSQVFICGDISRTMCTKTTLNEWGTASNDESKVREIQSGKRLRSCKIFATLASASPCGPLKHIFEGAWLSCKAIRITETVENDRTQTEVYVQQKPRKLLVLCII